MVFDRGWTSRFFSPYAVEHVCMIGFVKRRLALNKSEKGGMTYLRDQRHGGDTETMVPWELCEAVESRSVGKQWHYGGSVLCTWETSLLCRDVCLMPRTKFGFDTILNILATNMLYHVVYAKADVQGEVYNRNTENTRVTWFRLVGLHPRRNPLRATSLLYKSVV